MDDQFTHSLFCTIFLKQLTQNWYMKTDQKRFENIRTLVIIAVAPATIYPRLDRMQNNFLSKLYWRS